MKHNDARLPSRFTQAIRTIKYMVEVTVRGQTLTREEYEEFMQALGEMGLLVYQATPRPEIVIKVNSK